MKRKASSYGGSGKSSSCCKHEQDPELCRCPYAERVFITLKELSVPHKTVFIDLGNKTEEYTSLYHSVCLDPIATVRVPLYQGMHCAVLLKFLQEPLFFAY